MSRTAQVKRDARMGEAEARRDAGIRVSSAVQIAHSCLYIFKVVLNSAFLLLKSNFVTKTSALLQDKCSILFYS